jgi:carbonic anhydrase/acetyltransferase-like protein (isoleucine patch superfamily)
MNRYKGAKMLRTTINIQECMIHAEAVVRGDVAIAALCIVNGRESIRFTF